LGPLEMAIYIRIEKSNENEEFAEYGFGRENDISGRLRVCKNSGEIDLLVSAIDSNPDFVYRRAARKVYLHWKAGDFPDHTCWAA